MIILEFKMIFGRICPRNSNFMAKKLESEPALGSTSVQSEHLYVFLTIFITICISPDVEQCEHFTIKKVKT